MAKPRNRFWAAFFLLVIGLVVLGPPIQSRLDLLPGFQGMQDGIHSYKVWNSYNFATLGNAIPTPSGSCSYSWVGSPTIGSASVIAKTPDIFGLTCYTGQHSDTLVLDAQQNPVVSNSPYTMGKNVEYYVRVPNTSNNWQHVVGQVKVYTFNLGISIQSGSEGRWDFGGDAIMYNLYSQTWNQASKDPSNSSISGNAWEAPLYAEVTNVEWQNQGSSGASLTVVGAPLSFYSSPTTTGQTLATLAGQQFTKGVDVNKTLSSIYSPDSRLQRLVYYPITLTAFKANTLIGDCTLGCTYPSAKLTITLYTLQIGEYILTNPSTQQLQQRTQACTGGGCVVGIFGTLFSFLSNPFAQFGLFLIAALVLVAIIVIGLELRKILR